MLVQEYPITTPYGQVDGYPLHNGFHQGVDYGCPVGTPVIVNGVTIGLSGNTGYSSGAHCHVGKWVNGVVQNPLNGGFKFNNAEVTEINQDPQNGKYVRVQGDGASWVYCHLSNNQVVSVGTKLQGVNDMLSEDEFYEVFRGMLGRDPTPEEASSFSRDAHVVIATLWNNGSKARYEADKAGTPNATQLKPGVYEVK